MAYPTASDFTKYSGSKFTNTDWDNNVDKIVTIFSGGTYDMAAAKLGVGTTTLTYACNVNTSALARALNVVNSYATGTVCGGHITVSGASTANFGLYLTVSGATNNYGISSVVTAGGGADWAVGGTISGTSTLTKALNAVQTSTGAVNIGVLSTVSGAGTANWGFAATLSAATEDSRCFNGSVSGSTTNTYGIAIVNAATGTGAYGAKFTCFGAATTNYGVYSDVSGGTTNYSFYGVDAAFVKIGYSADTPPSAAVDNGSLFMAIDTGTFYLYGRYGGAWKKVELA